MKEDKSGKISPLALDPKNTIRQILKRLKPFFKPTDKLLAEPVASLVATILSQNTSDLNSERAYLALLAVYPDWNSVADADPEELAEVIRAGGLAKQKSRTIINALQTIRERHGDFGLEHFEELDNDTLIAELTAMPGVGLKTAACVLMFSMGRDLCAIDTHLQRVLNRLGVLQTKTPDKTFHALRPLIPQGKALELHVMLIRFGRHVCKAQRPHCFECPLYGLCQWPEKEAYANAGLRGARAVSGDRLLTDILTGNKE